MACVSVGFLVWDCIDTMCGWQGTYGLRLVNHTGPRWACSMFAEERRMQKLTSGHDYGPEADFRPCHPP